MTRLLGLAVALIAGFAIFYLGAVTPPPVPASAPAGAFSAERAMADVRAMGSTPHAVGSAANAKVRDYLIARMQALGLNPQVQRASSFASRGPFISGATVENVIGVLPGRDRSAPALTLMAHHDSVVGSPGAADDTAGVASALEIVRAIKAGGVPDRDVMVVITDGEEAGLLGAQAFFDESPLAAHVGYVVNMETRGGGGQAQMFETAADNGGDVALYRRTAQAPNSNALTVFIYKHMPNDTDFTVARKHGKVGLNYAFIGRQFDYHSPSSTPAALDEGSLQHMGAQVLPTARALAFGALPGRAPDVAYGNLLFGLTAAYPTGFGWLVLLLAVGLVVAGAARARRQGALSGRDIGRGVGASLYILAAGGAALELARRATGVGSGWVAYRPLLARFAVFELMMLAVAIAVVMAAAAFAGGRSRGRWIAGGAALAAGLAASLFGGFDMAGLVFGAAGTIIGVVSFGAPSRLAGTWTGVLAVVSLAGLALQILAPSAAYVVVWPLLAAGVAAAFSAAGADRRIGVQAAVVVIAALVLAWIGALFHGMLQGLDMAALAVAPTLIAAVVLWPLAFTETPEDATPWPAAAVIAVGLALAAWLHLSSPWTPRHPNAVEPLYVVDPAAHKAWRASGVAPDAWTLNLLKAEGGAVSKLPMAFAAEPLDAAPAAVVAATPAPASMTVGADGRVTLTVGLTPGAARVIVALRAPTAINAVTVNGKPAASMSKTGGPENFNLKAGQWGRVLWAAPVGFNLSFHTADPARVEVITAQIYDRWMAAKPLPPLPATEQMWDMAGSSVVLGKASR
jgi:hypothetical protein